MGIGLLDARGAWRWSPPRAPLDRAEYASVASSLFGVLTVLLAAWFLKETGPARCSGLASPTVFGGIAVLGLQE
jgi:hypothetical protein